jgi:serine/threonine protein kinase
MLSELMDQPPRATDAMRVIESVGSLIAAISQSRLLTPAQQVQLITDLQPEFDDPEELGQHLVERGWLTPFQLDQLLQGHTRNLVLGPYRLLEPLGGGSMGRVFKAVAPPSGRLVALKLVESDPQTDPVTVRRFRREAEAAARLSHPNIVALHDVGQQGETHYLVMEYLEGTNLEQLVQENGPLPVARACAFIRQAALGLQHAQEKGVVHRDIKPGNLVVTRLRIADDQPTIRKPQATIVKILDLGIARLDPLTDPEQAAGSLTRKGELLGTPDYIAPEQALDAHAVDTRADIYSLGCTLYFLLTARPPFVDGSLAQKLIWHQTIEPPAVEELRRDVPPELAAVVRRMMAKAPADRYPTPGEVASALKPFCVTRARRSRRRTSVPLPRFLPPARRPRRWRLPVAAAILAAVSGVLGLLFSCCLPEGNWPGDIVLSIASRGPFTARPDGVRVHTSQRLDEWQPLLEGPNLQGWDWRAAGAEHTRAKGWEIITDEGRPVLRLTGEVAGVLMSQKEFEGYHLRLEFRWCRPLSANSRRRSAVRYHCVATAGDNGPLLGLECPLGGEESGGLSFSPSLGLSLETTGQLERGRANELLPVVQYQPGGRAFLLPLAVASRVLPMGEFELPAGQWNTLEILTVDGGSMHRLNGRTTVVVTQLQSWSGLQGAPFRRGRIQLWSGAGEVWFRNMAVRPLERLPEGMRR